MTLQEQLRKIPDNQVVKIGCIDGSSFFYADNVTEETLDIIATISFQAYFPILKRIKMLNRKLKELDNNSKESLNRALKNKDIDLDSIAYVWEKQQNARYTSLKEQLEEAEQEAREWKLFEDREVVDVYKCLRPNTIAIMVEGDYRARFWDQDEFRRERSKDEEAKKTAI